MQMATIADYLTDIKQKGWINAIHMLHLQRSECCPRLDTNFQITFRADDFLNSF